MPDSCTTSGEIKNKRSIFRFVNILTGVFLPSEIYMGKTSLY
jgi:hypothetical protein